MTTIIIQPNQTTVTVAPNQTDVTLKPAPTKVIEAGTPGPAGPPGPSGSASYRDVLTVASPGQTTFNLLHTPDFPGLSQLYINGVKATYGAEYTINTSILSWLSSLRLEPTDEIEITYT